MWKRFWICLGVVAALFSLVCWAGATSTFLFSHPKTKGYRVEIDPRTQGAVVKGKIDPQTGAVVPLLPQTDEGAPRAAIDETEFDFGTMNPLTMGQHAFVIRNTGSAPLQLKVGPTSCKCTVSGLDKQHVLPGEQATVTLEWNTGKTPLYAHYATVFTNDPNRKSINLGVRGKIRMLIGADVPEIVFPSLPPDEPAVAEVLLYSQIWQSFTVENLSSQLAGLGWEVAPVDPGQVPQLEAKGVQKLRLTIPGDLPPGAFQDTLRLTVQPGNDHLDAEAQTLELPLQGAVQRRLAIYGSAIDSDGVVEFGNLQQGAGKKINLLVKIRDREPQLPMPTLEVQPAFITAQLTPRSTEGSSGLYNLTIEIPTDAPACQYLGTPQGTLTLRTGHPRIDDVQLHLRFAVLERRVD